jgi:hypothetical protein
VFTSNKFFLLQRGNEYIASQVLHNKINFTTVQNIRGVIAGLPFREKKTCNIHSR